VKKWKHQIEQQKNFPDKFDNIWFAGIPHGYFFPPKGKIEWKDIQIVNEK
jgi:hypothetical protein